MSLIPSVDYLSNPSDQPSLILDKVLRAVPLNHEFSKNVSLIRHYTLRDHTECVLSCFDRIFMPFIPVNHLGFYRLLLALHDIGKPQAIDSGDKYLQHRFTMDLLDDSDVSGGIDCESLRLLKWFLAHDYVGSYLKGHVQLDDSVKLLVSECCWQGDDRVALYDVLTIYYQSDVAGYTRMGDLTDALDFLYSWDDRGMPIMCDSNLRLAFNPNIELKYKTQRKAFLKHKNG